jgi:hypothetical protein
MTYSILADCSELSKRNFFKKGRKNFCTISAVANAEERKTKDKE